MAHNLPATFLESIVVDEDNVTPLELAAGSVIARLLPCLIIVLCLNGATTPAIDLTAGEKERGSMETILCSPVSRTGLVLGKFLLVFTASFTMSLFAITFLPGVELNLKTIFIPILNTSLVSREILAGTYYWGFIAWCLLLHAPMRARACPMQCVSSTMKKYCFVHKLLIVPEVKTGLASIRQQCSQ